MADWYTDLNEGFRLQFLAGQGMLSIPADWCQTNLSYSYSRNLLLMYVAFDEGLTMISDITLDIFI